MHIAFRIYPKQSTREPLPKFWNSVQSTIRALPGNTVCKLNRSKIGLQANKTILEMQSLYTATMPLPESAFCLPLHLSFAVLLQTLQNPLQGIAQKDLHHTHLALPECEMTTVMTVFRPHYFECCLKQMRLWTLSSLEGAIRLASWVSSAEAFCS